MALVPTASDSKSVLSDQENRSQPRQPTNLQGLLRFSMDVCKSEEAPHEFLYNMDEEKKKFLEGALSSMTLNVVEVLQKQIKLLRGIERMKDDDLSGYLNALDIILDYVDNLDTANDFHKIGGFLILNPCLRCRDGKIRATTCELIGVLSQNNPYCQNVMIQNGFVTTLLGIIEKDLDVQVIVKAILALGGIIRENKEGISDFLQHEGLRTLHESLRVKNDNVIIKICFLLSSLCRSRAQLKGDMVKLGYVDQLLKLLVTERCSYHEHVLSLLVTLLENNKEAVKECEKFNYNVKDVLQRYMQGIRNKDCLDEEEYCRQILHMINAER
ncbi:unnamed protein product [Phyllotreta striolata]|uniref:Uncharacterized protein n=1 Tax=Phyllotreta striolata TaxID=444603 RepID=A0A9N9XSH4_PHYSR|nr:unnamed protein product [Phyllotreta striolata]